MALKFHFLTYDLFGYFHFMTYLGEQNNSIIFGGGVWVQK